MEDFLLYKTLISPMLVTIVSYVLMVIFVFGLTVYYDLIYQDIFHLHVDILGSLIMQLHLHPVVVQSLTVMLESVV